MSDKDDVVPVRNVRSVDHDMVRAVVSPPEHLTKPLGSPYQHTTLPLCSRCGGTGYIGNGVHELDAYGNTYAPCPECSHV